MRTHVFQRGEHLRQRLRGCTDLREIERAATQRHFDRMRGGERASIANAQLRPGGVGDGDERACFPRRLGELRPGLAGPRSGEVQRQADGENVPEFADLGRGRM